MKNNFIAPARIIMLILVFAAIAFCLTACFCASEHEDGENNAEACNGNHNWQYRERFIKYYDDVGKEVVCYACTACGEEKLEPVELVSHSFVEEVSVEGDCQTDRVINHICTVCGWTKYEVLGKANHAWSGSSTAECGADGYFERSCTVCGESESGTLIGL